MFERPTVDEASVRLNQRLVNVRKNIRGVEFDLNVFALYIHKGRSEAAAPGQNFGLWRGASR
jgi:hypothetical protein